MIIPAAIRRRYDSIDYLQDVGNIVKQTVFSYCEGNGFAFINRYKTLESLASKVETGRFERWSLLDDLYACTVIIPTLTHESMVVDFLNRAFDMVTFKARGQARK